MGINMLSWLGGGGGGPASQEAMRADLAYRRITDKPSSIQFRTPAGTTLDAQTVRIELDSTASPTMSTAGKNARQRVVVFGIKGHDLFTDSDIKPGYRFTLWNEEFRCEDVIVTLGEIQGLFEAVG